MRSIIALALVALLPSTAAAFQAGVFADTPDSSCVAGPVGFEQFVWVWTSAGMVYVTLRIDIPENLAAREAPVFDSRIIEFVKTDYPDGSEEWHMVLVDCPGGWVRVFRQQVTLLDDQPSIVRIRGGDSWIRDCSFDLHRPDVNGGLGLNGSGCASVRDFRASWSALKHRHE